LTHIEQSTDEFGQLAFIVDVQNAANYGEYVSATAIDPNGNTSVVSNSVLVQGPSDVEQDGISDAVEDQVPNANGGNGMAPRLRAASSTRQALAQGDGNSDGVPDSQQANVVSFPSVAGPWLTLSAQSSLSFKSVTPVLPPDSAHLPVGYLFPLGAIKFTVTGLSSGGSILITNILHGTNALTTVFAYGPTAGQPAPHWYEFLFDGTVGAKPGSNSFTLALTDAKTGDQDLKADGQITTLIAPAFKDLPAPQLTLLSTKISQTDKPEATIAADGSRTVVTNHVPLVTSVLSWPASATGYALQYASRLAPTNSWQTVPDSPALINGRYVVTNTSVGVARFFQLRPF
jgi:hypothetical protein